MQIALTSNAEEILNNVRTMPARMGLAIAAAMDKENQITVGHIQATYLSGPRPLKLGVRTNRLRGSLRASKAVVDGDTVSSAIGTNVKYAGVHEYGFDGPVTVRSFTRRNRRADVRTAAGSFDLATGRITRGKGRTLASGISFVRSFSRHMRMPARPFLAPGIADRAPAYSAAISQAITEAWNGGVA